MALIFDFLDFRNIFQIPSCKLTCMKKNSIFSNDNEPDTMIPLGLAALELLNRLRSKMDLLDLMDGEEKQAERSNEGTSEKKDDERRDQQSDRYIEHRLRDLREFERRARGK